MQKIKVKNKARLSNINSATKAKGITAIIPNKKLITNPKLFGLSTDKKNQPTQNYIIKSGDSFWTISKQLNIPYSILINTGNNIVLYNKRSNGRLQTNDVIQIPLPKSISNGYKYLPNQRLNSDMGKGYTYIPPGKLEASRAEGSFMDGIFEGFLEAIINEVEIFVDTIKTVGSAIIRYNPSNPFFVQNIFNDIKN